MKDTRYLGCTSKSPLAVALAALEVGGRALRPYSHRNSPRVYTQPQLFACLALRQFLKADYRKTEAFLRDFKVLAAALGLKAVPHWTTLQKADRRLMTLRNARALLTATVRKARRRLRGPIRAPLAAADSSGFQCGHASSYYVRRRAKGQAAGEKAAGKAAGKPAQETRYKRFGKLEAVIDCADHLILAALAGRGPRPDADRLVPLLDEALTRVTIGALLADAGYDSEANHVYARETRGVRSVIPAEIGRPSPNPPSGKYRRLMKRNLTPHAGFLYCRYGQRWQVETVFSMLKRLLGDSLAALSHWGQRREMLLKAITLNVLLGAAA